MEMAVPMKRDFSSRAGIGFTVVVAVLTLAVAVLSGIFLLYDSDTGLQANAPPELPAASASAPAGQGTAKPPHTDHLRAKPRRIAQNQRPHRGKSA